MRLYGLLKRNTVSLSSVLLTLLLVIACGTAAEPVSEQPVPQAQAEPAAAGGEPAGAPIAQPTEAAQPAATGQVKVDRLVIVGEVQAYETTDPYAMSPSSLPQIHVMYENLLGVDRDTVAYTPMLAESWEVAPDLQAVTFKLREGVQWHQDYGEFTAQNLIASYEAMVSEHSITTYKEEYWSRVMDPANAAGNFEALGDHEITFKYSSPQLDSDLFVSRIVDFTILSKAHIDKEGMVEGPRDNPVGTGPYQLQEHKLGEAYVFERVP